MQDIEIPGVAERSRRYRAFEVLPGLLSWGVLLLPVALASTLPRLLGPIALGLLGAWILASIGFNIAAVRGLRSMRRHTTRPWAEILRELDDDRASQLIHAVIVATWNESREVLEPTIRAVLASDFDLGRVIFVLAYEARGGPLVERQAHQLVAGHGAPFMHAMAVRHDDRPGEVVGKGANITGAARELERYLAAHGINPARVVVTTLDADNRPHPSYLAALTYAHCSAPDPVRAAFQPVAVYTSNIWDAPAPMRVIAITSSLWNIGLSLRPRLIRNFSSHAQNMRALIDMDFWSVRTVVEDGHQFWRSYFWHDGRYTVHPVPVPTPATPTIPPTGAHRRGVPGDRRARSRPLTTWRIGPGGTLGPGLRPACRSTR